MGENLVRMVEAQREADRLVAVAERGRAFVGLVAAGAAALLLWPTEWCITTVALGGKNRKSCMNLLGLRAEEPVALSIAVVTGLAVAIFLWRFLTRRASDN